ncbi:MAG: class I SAM-dependent methyltransferase [Planctomycetaceae bacterium]|nr:class I SAM-dependent methyltransferase [Planctomycetaceae bacterium]
MKIWYDRRFYKRLSRTSSPSADEIVPFVIDLIAPKSVCDVGCGNGAWLASFARSGIQDFVGFDGKYVAQDQLLIPPDQFVPCDLENALPEFDRQFDLAVSLEVAEHLCAERAVPFIESLSKLAPAVLFSAAIPYQGGRNHINEQEPQYWADIFAKFDYLPIDCIRPQFWNNEKVSWWYRQNMFLYVRKNKLTDYVKLPSVQSPVLTFVHPVLLKIYANQTLWKQIRKRVKRFLGLS